ncbi:hypothetical protein L1987_63969 [Smallanthus sonchifolius]|uniref:Uncharacterized protein n=1 Tax=Smallanthus sonchifolius TaxID=185202 RepID=A0ACB9CET3_9ASTR|nr:hypothetical protein L1987_63969 [Smallanthus sonchifolius]
MLNLRPLIRNHIWTNVGDGTTTSAWFDKWDEVCPISTIVTPRCIANAGFNMNTQLAEIYVHGEWMWPDSWISRFPVLLSLRNLVLVHTQQDKLEWRSRLGLRTEFSTFTVWDDLRQSQNEVLWSNVVWFSQAIPKHSFFMWLIVHKKLKTHDVMCKWNSSGNMNLNLLCCSLCTSGPDSHEHLFFECEFAAQVWNGVRDKACMDTIQNKWSVIFDFLVGIANSKKAIHVIAKLVVSAAAYFVWEERNRRLFTSKRRNKNQLVEVILSTVRMKLHTMRFKRSIQTARVLQEWMLPRGLLVADDECG